MRPWAEGVVAAVVQPPVFCVIWGSLLLALAIVLMASSGSAQVRTASLCADQSLLVEGALSALWFEPVKKLCEDLGTMDDIDHAAQLRVSAARSELLVEVMLPDGRSTLRRVHAPQELPRTIEALVTVPPLALAGPPPSVPPDEALDADAELPPPPEPEVYRWDPFPQPVEPSLRLHLEMGAAVMGRLAGTPTYLSIGVSGYVGLRVGPWLLALMARWDGYQNVLHERPEDFQMVTGGGGLQLLREVYTVPGFALEAGGDLWLLGETMQFGYGVDQRACSVIDVRLGLIVRMLFGQGPARFMTSLDGEVSPARLQRELHMIPGLPLVPAWSVGLAVGVAWEVL